MLAVMTLLKFCLSLVVLPALLACGGSGATPPSSLPVTDRGAVALAPPATQLPSDWPYGAVMQVYVRAYQDSNGDGIGDLKGLTQRLDYLASLGIKGIWLMPVTASSDRDHGYAVQDYRAIEPDYGTLDDLRAFIQAAHTKGIGVITDYLINHASDQHPLFRNARASAQSPDRNYFVWQAEKPTGWDVWGKDPWYAAETGHYFATFGSNMPDFNWRNPAVEAFHFDNIRHWLNLGLDGIRFDATKHLIENSARNWDNQPESHAIMRQVRELVRQVPHAHMVCEAPAAVRDTTESCGQAFDFDLPGKLFSAVNAPAENHVAALAAHIRGLPANPAVFLANHDRFAGDRVWNQVGGDLGRAKRAAASILLMPGTPYLYYGEEIGMGSNPTLSGDWGLRTPMSWTASSAGFSAGQPFRAASGNQGQQNVAAEEARPEGLLHFYRQLMRLRNARPSIAQGERLQVVSQGAVLLMELRRGQEGTLVLLNYSDQSVSQTVTGLSRWKGVVSLLGAADMDASISAGGTLRVSLPAGAVAVLGLSP
jgi:glycosidase